MEKMNIYIYSLLKIKIKTLNGNRLVNQGELIKDELLQARVSKVSLERSPQGQPEGQEKEVWTTWPSWTVTQGLPITHMIHGDYKQEFT